MKPTDDELIRWLASRLDLGVVAKLIAVARAADEYMSVDPDSHNGLIAIANLDTRLRDRLFELKAIIPDL